MSNSREIITTLRKTDALTRFTKIETNALEEFYRNQTETDKYRAFKEELKSKGSTIVQYIIKNRLGWIDENGLPALEPASVTLFTDPSDVLIITNDFPYNFGKPITHFVVWSKVIIESDPESKIGDVSDHTKNIINTYVKKTFVDQLGLKPENVNWFRNFPAIQSVRELSHIHILIRDLDKKDFDKVYKTSGVVLDENDLA